MIFIFGCNNLCSIRRCRFSIIIVGSKRCTLSFISILLLELYFLDLVGIGFQSCERSQSKFGGSKLRTDNLHISIGGFGGLIPFNLNLALSYSV